MNKDTIHFGQYNLSTGEGERRGGRGGEAGRRLFPTQNCLAQISEVLNSAFFFFFFSYLKAEKVHRKIVLLKLLERKGEKKKVIQYSDWQRALQASS